MGRKIDMKKIEDITKCQVTFSKRRSSLMKKANEISICCDVDVAFVAFSPSGRVSKFSNQKRIEDVIHRYVSLPPETRLSNISNVQKKMGRLESIDHIIGETSKLHYLDKQIENLQLQITKKSLELQIMETDLRDYEVDPALDPSLHQLSWCERNLKHSRERINARKNELLGKPLQPIPPPAFQMPEFENQNDGVMLPTNLNQNEGMINPAAEVEPWMSPLISANAGGGSFDDLFEQENRDPNLPILQNIADFSMPNESAAGVVFTSGLQINNIPSQVMVSQPLVNDQTFSNLPEQNNDLSWEQFFEGDLSDVNYVANNNNLYIIQSPGFNASNAMNTDVVDMVIPQEYDQIGNNATNPNFNQLLNALMDLEPDQVDNTDAVVNNNMLMGDDNNAGEDVLNYDIENLLNELNATDQVPSPIQIDPGNNEITQDDLFDNLQKEDGSGDKEATWDWADLLCHDNFNIEDIGK